MPKELHYFRDQQGLEIDFLETRSNSNRERLGFFRTPRSSLLVVLRVLDYGGKSLLEQKLYLLIQRAMFTFCKVGKAILEPLLDS